MDDLAHLEQYADDIYTCNRTRCGFCREECPVYRIKQLETYSCRGKMLVARGLLEGMLEPSVEMAEMLNECALCGYCQARCALHNLDVVTALRTTLVEAGYAAGVHAANTRRIAETGSLFDAPTPIRREGAARLYLGCLYRSQLAEVAKVVSVLERSGIDPLITDEACCGYIVEGTGFAAEFETVRGRFREVYPTRPDEEILTLCPTCTITLRDKYGLKVKHALVALAERLPGLELRPVTMKATYHDPCHLGRMLGVTEEPRAILAALGVGLVEMEHSRTFSTCCGGGGGLTAVDPQVSIEVAKNRVRDALQVGVEHIVTACPTCAPTLLRAAGRLANEVDVFVDVHDLWDLLDQALVT
jgi:Fe-S oxidoreductase